jgi:hypothetical protein
MNLHPLLLLQRPIHPLDLEPRLTRFSGYLNRGRETFHDCHDLGFITARLVRLFAAGVRLT